jgi:hypothetical protein
MVTSCSSNNWGRGNPPNLPQPDSTTIEVLPAAAEPIIRKETAPPGLTNDNVKVFDRTEELKEAKKIFDANIH